MALDAEAAHFYFVGLPLVGSGLPEGVYRSNLDGSNLTFLAALGRRGPFVLVDVSSASDIGSAGVDSVGVFISKSHGC